MLINRLGVQEEERFIKYNVLISVTMKDSIIYVRVSIMSHRGEKIGVFNGINI